MHRRFREIRQCRVSGFGFRRLGAAANAVARSVVSCNDAGIDGSWTRGSFLERLSETERRALLALGTPRRVTSGDRILREGEPGRHILLIQRGFVKVTILAGQTESLLQIRLPGDLVGELAVLTGDSRSATVTACGEVVVIGVAGAAFLRFLADRPTVYALVTANVAQQLAWANARRVDVAAYPVRVRLARVLEEIAAACGEPAKTGAVVIPVDLSQDELATMVGVTQDTVQRTLRGLRRDGLIETGYRRVTITDPGRLARLIQAADE